MITDKAVKVSKRIDAYCYKTFGDAYTLKTTFWEDGDFRVFAYSSKQVPEDKPWKKLYVELRYQDSKLEEGKAVRHVTAQHDDVPRSNTQQFPVEDLQEIELPTLRPAPFRTGDEKEFQKPDHDPMGETQAAAAHSTYTCPVCRKTGLVGTIALDFMEEDNYLIVCQECA